MHLTLFYTTASISNVSKCIRKGTGGSKPSSTCWPGTNLTWTGRFDDTAPSESYTFVTTPLIPTGRTKFFMLRSLLSEDKGTNLPSWNWPKALGWTWYAFRLGAQIRTTLPTAMLLPCVSCKIINLAVDVVVKLLVPVLVCCGSIEKEVTEIANKRTLMFIRKNRGVICRIIIAIAGLFRCCTVSVRLSMTIHEGGVASFLDLSSCMYCNLTKGRLDHILFKSITHVIDTNDVFLLWERFSNPTNEKQLVAPLLGCQLHRDN